MPRDAGATTMHDAAAAPVSPRPRTTRTTVGATVAILALLACFAIASWTAARTKGATFDETLHAPAAYVGLRYGDFRVNPEHPPLWKDWAALPWLIVGPRPDVRLESADFRSATRDGQSPWRWARDTLFLTPGNDAYALLARQRAMMLALATLIGGVVAAWAWRLGGPTAGVVAAALFALDPNLLAHAPLVCNDVATAGAFAAVACATWRVGRRLTLGRMLWLGGLCGAALATKFTAVLLGPIVAALLVGRALSTAAWPTSRRPLETRRRRLVAASIVLTTAAAMSIAILWAAYDFRFAAAPNGGPSIALNETANRILAETAKLDEHVALSPAQAAQRPRDPTSRVVLALAAARALPEGYLGGFLFAYEHSILRPTFRLGATTDGGVWWYFPFCVVVKSPLATLAAIAIASVVGVRAVVAKTTRFAGLDGWSWACLLVPLASVVYVAMRASVNIGVRHVFAAYPFAFIAIGVIAASWIGDGRGRRRGLVAAGLLVALAVESLSSWPDFIPFFNVAAGGASGGFRLLGDSNLDWGQDVPALVRWQAANPTRTLTLAYFGTDVPSAHGLRYVSLVGDDARATPASGLPTHGVLAVSASLLQGRWDDPTAARYFASAARTPPTQILGGTIYLYDLGGQ